MVLLKTIDGIEIWVYEDRIADWSYLSIIPFLMMALGAWWILFIPGFNSIVGLGIFGASIAIAFVTIPMVPGYTVWIPTNDGSRIKFKKTTPEKDREAICKAMNELVKVAQEIARKKKELNEIAEFCEGR